MVGVSLIMCVNDEEWGLESELYIKALKVPVGFGMEIIKVKKALSMTSGYNVGMRIARYKYKVYLHQDTLILNKNFITEMVKIFEDKGIGLIGMIGAKRMPGNGIWWEGEQIYGRVLHHCESESVVDSHCLDPLGEYEEVEVVDGFLMCTQYDLEWDESFDGFHFYDVTQCMKMSRAGYKVVVPRQGENWSMHCPCEKPLEKSYEKYRRKYLKKYLQNNLQNKNGVI